MALTGNQTVAGNKTLSGTTTLAATVINGATQLKGAVTATGAITSSGNVTFNTGQVTFNNKAPISSVAPTAANHLATKAYVDRINTTLTESINTKANANAVVTLTGNQTVAGVKTFSSPVVVPNATENTHAVNLAQLNTKANANATVNLTGNQTIAGIKTFSSIPVSTTQPTNANQVANKAYVDAIAAKKANFITATVKIGASETIKNLNEFKTFAQNNFAHLYTILITSDIDETSALTLRGLNIAFNSTNYTITFKQNVDFHCCKVFFGKIGLKIDSQTSVRITFLSSEVYINGNVTFTDLVPASVVTTQQPSAIVLYGSRFSTGGNDDWNITSTARNFIGITHSYLGLINITFTGSLSSGKTLFNFELQGILMTQSCVFNNLSVASIAQNQLTNKGIWFNV